jgi:hypothetical protein
MATTKELSVEDKLRAIYDLQIIDSRIDEIRNVRGELPLEVEDLEDEVTGLSTRLDKLKSDLVTIEEQIKNKKNAIDDHQAAIKKYSSQQKEVRNNREFNSLTKEVEFQELEIQLAEKQIKELKASIEHKKEVIANSKEKLDQKNNASKTQKSGVERYHGRNSKRRSLLNREISRVRSPNRRKIIGSLQKNPFKRSQWFSCSVD